MIKEVLFIQDHTFLLQESLDLILGVVLGFLSAFPISFNKKLQDGRCIFLLYCKNSLSLADNITF